MVILNKAIKRKIESKVEEILEDAKMLGPFAVDLFDVAERFEIRVIDKDLGNISGMSFMKNNQKYIVLNTRESKAERKNFTLAHEIGHMFLHHAEPVSVSEGAGILLRDSNSSAGNDIKEIEANFFAASLLMPRSSIEKWVINKGTYSYLSEETLLDMATDFNVSIAAMSIRLSSLGFC